VSALLSVAGVSKRFRGLVAVDRASFEVARGEIFAVIGPNGAGKTTLFSMIAGALKPDEGALAFQGEYIDGLRPDEICRRGIARTFQIVRPFPALTVEDNVMIGALLRTADTIQARAKVHDVMRRHHARVAGMELVVEALGLKLLVNRVDAVGDDERGSFVTLGEEVAHRAIERPGHANSLAVAREQGERTVNFAHGFGFAGEHAPARFVHGHVIDAVQ